VTHLLNKSRNRELPEIDLILCPGDLSDKADASALDHAWNFLINLKAALGNPTLVNATGNHDLDSRFAKTDFDPKGNLFGLAPSYPVVLGKNDTIGQQKEQQIRLNYWARNFAIFYHQEVRIVVLNSAAFHGYGVDNKEYEHGRVSKRTLDDLRAQLEEDQKNKGRPPLNIIVFHHHLEADPDVDSQDNPDASVMVGAPQLTELLSKVKFGPWLAVHGHRHHPRLYQKGGNSGPIVLQAASFGATNQHDYQNRSPNQIHFVSLVSG